MNELDEKEIANCYFCIERGNMKGGDGREGGGGVKEREWGYALEIQDFIDFGPAPQTLPKRSNCGGPFIAIGLPSKKAAIWCMS